MKVIHAEITVIGAGHAGCEAAIAASKFGLETILVTQDKSRIAWMPCNPSIGGIGKGHLVKEIDVLGGVMGEIIDRAGIQFRVLNRSKGPAVQAIRAQADKFKYKDEMVKALLRIKNLKVVENELHDFKKGKSKKVELTFKTGLKIFSKAIVICTGTFLNGLIHIGFENYPGGRIDDRASSQVVDSLKKLNIAMGRLKTGTTPRLDSRTIYFRCLEKQEGDIPPSAFSINTKKLPVNTECCYITHTNERTHEIILNNLDRSPLFAGRIKGIGPRYCPSIEDKVVKFRERDKHQVFLEPEGEGKLEIYPNGISTSLPIDAQREMIRTIKGLEEAEIIQPGYAVEYNFIFPEQLNQVLQLEKWENIFFAGQINGTSGYEEAAAQGLIAGINAALFVKKMKPFILSREESYIGVLVDDIIHKRIREPYRMFTSRAERRLYLRNDNVEKRLLEKGYNLGLINESTWKTRKEKWMRVEECMELMRREKVTVKSGKGIGEKKISIDKYVKRPDMDLKKVKEILMSFKMEEEVIQKAAIEIKYEGYLKKEEEMLLAKKKLENVKIPHDLDIQEIEGLTGEERELMSKYKPSNLKEAERYCGLRPASVDKILFIVKRNEKRRKS